MRTLLKFVLLLVSGLVVFSACTTASDVSPSAQTERIAEPTATPEQMTSSEIEERQTQARVGNFLFYNSYASW